MRCGGGGGLVPVLVLVGISRHATGRGQARGPPSTAAPAPCPYTLQPHQDEDKHEAPPIDRRARPLSLHPSTPPGRGQAQGPPIDRRARPLSLHSSTPPGRGQARGPPSTAAPAPCPYAPFLRPLIVLPLAVALVNYATLRISFNNNGSRFNTTITIPASKKTAGGPNLSPSQPART